MHSNNNIFNCFVSINIEIILNTFWICLSLTCHPILDILISRKEWFRIVSITYIGCTGYCPHIEEDVTLSGKYEFVGNIEDCHAIFRSYTCPIDENSKLNYYDQCEEYKYLRPCENKFDCPIAKGFKEEVFL